MCTLIPKGGSHLPVSPFARGEGAARTGLPVTANPYNDDQYEHQQAWFCGYASYQRRTHPHKGVGNE